MLRDKSRPEWWSMRYGVENFRMCYICISVYELLIALYVITLCVGR